MAFRIRSLNILPLLSRSLQLKGIQIQPASRSLTSTITKTTCIVRGVPKTFADCLMHKPQKINISVAEKQHEAYVAALKSNPDVSEVIYLSANDKYPDCVFIEDTAVIVGNKAILGSCAEPSRQGEKKAIQEFFEVRSFQIVELPTAASMDGGDVLLIGPHMFVGRSKRTNDRAFEILKDTADEYGVQAHQIEVTEGLHLKSSVSYGGPEIGLFSAKSSAAMKMAEQICAVVKTGNQACGVCTDIHTVPDAPAANVLRVGNILYHMNQFKASNEFFQKLAVQVQGKHSAITFKGLDVSEIVKADGALTCCSVLIHMSL